MSRSEASGSKWMSQSEASGSKWMSQSEASGRVRRVLLLVLCSSCGAADKMIGPETPEVSISVEGLAAPRLGDEVRLRAVAKLDTYSSTELLAKFSWRVLAPNGNAAPDVQLSGVGDQRLRFVPQVIGAHVVWVRAQVEGFDKPVDHSVTINVSDPNAIAQYLLRVTPPLASGLPTTEHDVQVGQADRTVQLSIPDGLQRQVRIEGPSGELLDAALQLHAWPGSPAHELQLPGGTAQLTLTGMLHALVVPTSSELAPLLLSNVVAKQLPSPWVIKVGAGERISGKVLLGALPLGGATVTVYVLDAASKLEVPSTIGTSAPDGTFSLRVHPGTARIAIVPPRASGLPVTLSAATAIDQAQSIEASYPASVVQPVTARVTRADGVSAAQARVTFSAATLGGAASIKVGTSTVTTRAALRQELLTDAAGVVVDAQGKTPSLPPGEYDVEVVPGPNEPASDGRVVQRVKVPGAALVLSLARRVELRGRIIGQNRGDIRAAVRLQQSCGTSCVGQSFSASTDSQGQFALVLDDQQTYGLTVRPLDGESQLGVLLVPTVVVKGATDLKTLLLPRAVKLSGTLTSTSGARLPGALVRAYCSGKNCTDALIDEGRSGSDGRFELRLPPP